ncbi:hypothetical protein [Herbiconiux flava]|uniref:Uncharacterized protein n=1 Tax=Herbiconiux flava TaxID=881268 RepID=A0A852SP37_9MICO|nr:hypothetical protein [Herbiconiux flava]NYD70564.1 hypothetical protein [Herbiconiux flava]GLK17319.1 hypothetical protein GCM10017602_18010 [Herbiconiux flava]
MYEVDVHTFATQLRGVEVLCTVENVEGEEPVIGVETRALDVERGLRAVSRFAGYCQRTLILAAPSIEDEQWAGVLASYFGFGLVVDDRQRRQIMPPPEMDAGNDAESRRRFVQRVLQNLDAAS